MRTDCVLNRRQVYCPNAHGLGYSHKTARVGDFIEWQYPDTGGTFIGRMIAQIVTAPKIEPADQEVAWEQLQRDIDAEQVWPFPVKVYSEGRSAGWAIIGHGTACRDHWTRDDVAAWDAVAVARWGKFARIARACADDVPYQYLSLVYLNVYLPWREDEDQRLAKAYAERRLSV